MWYLAWLPTCSINAVWQKNTKQNKNQHAKDLKHDTMSYGVSNIWNSLVELVWKLSYWASRLRKLNITKYTVKGTNNIHMTQNNIWIVWCAVPCIFLGVALSECQSAWTWDLHWLPAGQRWVLRASRPLYALSWPFSKKLKTCCRCFHWDITETFQGAPKVFQFLLFLILFSDKRPGGEEEAHTETNCRRFLLFPHHVLNLRKNKE